MTQKFRRRPVASDKRFRKRHDISDYGPRERWQHSGRLLEPTESRGMLAARATEEHIIDVLVLCGLIDKSQSTAAFKFKQDYQRAALAVHVTSSYTPVAGMADYFHGGRERNDFEEAAYQRWRNAVRALGLRLSTAVVAVVCHDTPPAPRDIPALQKGLDKLVDWYKLPKEENRKEGSSK